MTGLLGQGVRREWAEVPDAARAWAGALLGGEVVSAVTCAGGFSPGVAAAVTLADGRRAFVKAVSAHPNPRTPPIYRQEAAVNAWLPEHPALPALLGTFDDGDWVVLVFEHVDAGTPPLPWRRPDLDAVLAAVRSVQAAAGSVAGRATPIAEQFADDFAAWAALRDAPPEGLDAWSAARLDTLAEVEAGWASAAAGDDLVHSDLRADNVLVRDGRAWVVDWPWACAGAAWVDAVLMAPSVVPQGGPPPEELVAAAYPDAPADRVLPVVAALAGYFTRAALAPPPPGLPTLRAHQAACGRAAREWLARLLG
ncbi:MAG TPA: hypothetical protein VFQ85_01840 [Mycobacteriales bacterium]|nr:hypothetical protein [Mycobacteriales bacterium]